MTSPRLKCKYLGNMLCCHQEWCLILLCSKALYFQRLYRPLLIHQKMSQDFANEEHAALFWLGSHTVPLAYEVFFLGRRTEGVPCALQNPPWLKITFFYFNLLCHLLVTVICTLHFTFTLISIDRKQSPWWLLLFNLWREYDNFWLASIHPALKAIGGVRVKIFILSYFKELHKGDQRLFTECQN